MRKEPKKEPNKDTREEARSTLLRYIARSLEAGVVYRRAFVESVLLPLSIVLLYSVLSSTVA